MKKLTLETFIEKAKKIHGNKYNYSKVAYIKAIEKIVIICKKHGDFLQTPHNHLQGQHCPKCRGYDKTTELFIEQANIIHNNYYDYSKVVYTTSKEKIIITCKKHGDFLQTPSNHLTGNRCPKCGNNHITTNEFITKSKNIHGDKYDYSHTIFLTPTNKITIICKHHGEFSILPREHIKGGGCQKCTGRYKTTEEFIEQASKIHGNKYDYTKTNYINWFQKIEIICKNHGPFWQQPSNHLTGHGCPNCLSSTHTSKAETEWLNSLGITKENRHIKILNYRVDGYDPETNTIYEFNGDYWHGNPSIYLPDKINHRTNKTFGELHENTIKRENILRNAGYNVISIWESDWNKIKINNCFSP
jgi:hypothetical protein